MSVMGMCKDCGGPLYSAADHRCPPGVTPKEDSAPVLNVVVDGDKTTVMFNGTPVPKCLFEVVLNQETGGSEARLTFPAKLYLTVLP